MQDVEKNKWDTPPVQGEVPMVRRLNAPVPVALAGVDMDRLVRQKAWADRNEYDWLVIR